MFWEDSLKAARAPGEAVRAWLLDVLPYMPGWKTAREIEAEREAAGVSARALRTARERLLADGAIEKGRDGFQGPWRYRRPVRTLADALRRDFGPSRGGGDR